MRIPGARKLAALLVAAAMVLAVGAGSVMAVPGYGERPGNGNGDANHAHDDGPPPQEEGENDRPGNGNGDGNHTHDDGPPGQNLPDDD